MKKNNKPRVSILMPFFNAGSYVSTSLTSILNQSFKNFQLVIVDDASSDSTREKLTKIADKRLKIIRNRSRLGIAASLNRALKEATGSLIARMDADDIAHPDRLKKQIIFLDQHKAIGVIGTQAKFIDKRGKIIGQTHNPLWDADIRRKLMSFNPIVHPSVIVRRELLDKFGSYDETLDGAEDYDLWLRFARFTKFRNLGECLLFWRRSSSAVSFKDIDRIQSMAIRVRLKALKTYGYSWKEAIDLLSPMVRSLLPLRIKHLIYKHIYGYG